jgi:DNA repair exonuclease SbcCD ATPase subunit
MRRITMVLALELSALLCGCATTGYERASEARSAIGDARAVTVTIQHELDATLSSLQNLTSNDVTNLQPPFQVFSRAVDGLADQLEKLAHRAQAIQDRGNSYVAEWQEDLGSYQSADIRARSATRRGEVIDSFRNLNTEFQATQTSLRPVFASLKDLQRYLSTDLTASGITSVQEQAEKISAQVADAQQHLQSLVSNLDQVAIELSPLKPAKEEPVPAKQAPNPSPSTGS